MRNIRRPLITLIICIAFPSFVLAGDWRVTPIKVVFDRNQKSDIVTVSNEGSENIRMQVNAMEWTQDGEGKDLYSATDDLIFFPKILQLEKNEKRIIRLGIKVPAKEAEKTYRLFIREIPGQKEDEGKEVRVAIAIRFGLPVFVSPMKEEVKGEVEKAELLEGKLNLRIKNPGNTHFTVRNIKARGAGKSGEETFLMETAGWYILHDTSKAYTMEIPPGTCKKTEIITIETITDRFTFQNKLDVNKAMCKD